MSDFNLMLAKKYDPARVESWKTMYAEPKLDGVRAVILVDLQKEKVTFHSRNGRQLFMFSHLHHEVLKFSERLNKDTDGEFENGAMLDGEMVSSSGDFGDISGAIHTKGVTREDARFACFHAMPLRYFIDGADEFVQSQRADAIETAVKRCKLKLIQHHKATRVRNHEQVMDAYNSFIKAGWEGAIVKDYDTVWTAKRSYSWMKIKEMDTVDVIVTGMKEGKGKYVGMCGALIVDHRGKKVRVSGMDDKLRKKFWRSKKDVIGKMVEVEFQKVTKHNSLRHVRFKRLREDKQ